MKEQIMSVDDFKRYVPRVKCISLFHYNLINAAKLRELCTVRVREPESVDDLAALRDMLLVWYRDEKGEPVYWDSRGARNIALADLAAEYAGNPELMNEKMRDIVRAIREGALCGAEIICVHDTILDKTMVVDGVYRAVALYYLYLTDRPALDKLAESGCHISCITLESPAGSLLFPCDFINISRDARPAGS